MKVCVFDLNGTLLDLSALDPHFHAVFGEAGARRLWFDQLIELAMTATMTGEYQAFGTLAGAALEMLAVRRKTALAPEAKQAILQSMRRLPAYPDVTPALERMRAAGLRLAALTNSALDVAQEQVEAAGLAALFEQVLSVDTVRRFKPAPEPYRMAADRLGVAVSDVRLIAAHGWDIAGAHAAGCATAFVARPDQALNPLGPTPGMVGKDVGEIAGKVLAGAG